MDPLAGLNLDPLLDALSGHELIMHGADYDLRLLRKHHEFVPSAIFDTMLAARLLGVRQFGLGHLVEKYLGVKLEKGPAESQLGAAPADRADGALRPQRHALPQAARRPPASRNWRPKAGWPGTRNPARGSSRNATTHRPPDMDAVWRIKGSHLLEPPGAGRPARALAMARSGGHRRQPAAVLRHEPRGAGRNRRGRRRGQADRAVPAPAHLRTPPRRANEGHRARSGPLRPTTIPAPLRRICRRPSEGERRRFAELQKRRDAHAAELGIDPTLIASRGMLSDLAHDWDKHAGELMNWQRELLSAQPAGSGMPADSKA